MNCSQGLTSQQNRVGAAGGGEGAHNHCEADGSCKPHSKSSLWCRKHFQNPSSGAGLVAPRRRGGEEGRQDRLVDASHTEAPASPESMHIIRLVRSEAQESGQDLSPSYPPEASFCSYSVV